MGFHRQRTMWLWRNPDNVTHRQLLSIDQVWQRSTALTWSRWGCCRVADNIGLLAHANNNNSFTSTCWLLQIFLLPKGSYWLEHTAIYDQISFICQFLPQLSVPNGVHRTPFLIDVHHDTLAVKSAPVYHLIPHVYRSIWRWKHWSVRQTKPAQLAFGCTLI